MCCISPCNSGELNLLTVGCTFSLVSWCFTPGDY
jgi:hypothetical protein